MRSLRPWLQQNVHLTLLAQSCGLWGIDGDRRELWIWESRGRAWQPSGVEPTVTDRTAAVAPLQRFDGVVAPFATITCCGSEADTVHTRLDAQQAGALLDVFARIELQQGTADLRVEGAFTRDFGFHVDAVGVVNGEGFGFSYAMFPTQRFHGQASVPWDAFLTLLESHCMQHRGSMLRW